MKRSRALVEQAQDQEATSIARLAQHLGHFGHTVLAVNVLTGNGRLFRPRRPARPRGSIDPEVRWSERR